MSTTAAQFLLKPRFTTFTRSPASSTATFNLSLRFVSGLFSGGGSFSQASSGSKKTIFPQQGDPVFDKNGRFTDPWYRLLQRMWNVNLGGDLAPTITDLHTNVLDILSTTASVSAALPAIVSTVQTNAASQQAANQSLVAAGAPGAASIPPVVTTVPGTNPVNSGNV